MKKSILSLLAVAAMVSCTQNDMDQKDFSGDQVEIRLTPNVGTVAQTRTSYDVTAPTATDSLAAVVMVSTVPNLYNPANSTLLNSGSYRISFKDATTPTGFTDGATGLATPVYYPANGDDVYMWGLYPYGKVVTGAPAAGEWQMTAAGSTANYTFTGKEDVMVTKEIKSDKSEATTTVNYANTKLEFSHLLTKLAVKAKGDAAAKTAFGAITDITLVGVSVATPTSNIKNKVAISLATDNTLASPATVAFTGAEASFPFYAYDITTAPATPKQLDKPFAGLGAATTPVAFDVPDATTYPTGQLIAYSMVQPIDNVVAGSVAYILNVKTENGETNGFNVPVVLMDNASPAAQFAGSTVSKTFTIQLTFKAAEIKSIVAVGAWTPQGDFEFDIQ